ncbi:MAG TPA: methyltransferase [Dermatophilaceae bacterium]|nr:methyltransferase [Dermatophilaceae bacterium]
MTDHYFTAAPASATELRPIRVTLAGHAHTLTTAGGVFSPDRLDKGTAILLEEVPAPPSTGSLLDLGCGWGPVALTMALLSPDADVYAVDVNARALDLVRHNAATLAASRVIACAPDDVPADVRFATIWSNPPIRVGKAVLHDLLRAWLPRLEATGTAYLVVQKNLGADSLQRWISTELRMPCERHATSGGFRVLAVRHGH